jgi:ABC-type branched-subunit amino acid transport system ATPase component
MLLEVKNLTKRFGGFTAVSKVDLAVRQGEVRAANNVPKADRDAA